MLSVQQAIERLLDSVQTGASETIPLDDSPGRFLATDIQSPIALPLFDNSAMDGWAVRSADVAGASTEAPALLKKIATIPAGTRFEGEIGAGKCVRIFTGSPLPAGADAVVMQEDCRGDGENVFVMDGVKPWENIRFKGEDVKEGAIIGRRGDKVTPGLIALLGACGIEKAEVYKPVRLAILATGSELRAAGEKLQPGEIFESNRRMLAAAAEQAAVIPEIRPVVADDLESAVAAIRGAADADAILTCGGVSVGEFDFVKDAINHLRGSVDFWRVAVRPGKPFLSATVLGKPVFGLPGNPVSALVTFMVFVKPALLKMAGARQPLPAKTWGSLAEQIDNPGDRTHFARVVLDQDGLVRLSGPQASHRLASLADANALLEIPPGAKWEKGRQVAALPLY